MKSMIFLLLFAHVASASKKKHGKSRLWKCFKYALGIFATNFTLNSKTPSSTFFICPSSSQMQCADALVTDIRSYITNPKEFDFEKYLMNDQERARLIGKKSQLDKTNIREKECTSRNYYDCNFRFEWEYFDVTPTTVTYLKEDDTQLNGLLRDNHASLQSNDQASIQNVESFNFLGTKQNWYDHACPFTHSKLLFSDFSLKNVWTEAECRNSCSETPSCEGYAIGRQGSCVVYTPRDFGKKFVSLFDLERKWADLERKGGEFKCYEKKFGPELLIQKTSKDSIIVLANPNSHKATEIEIPRLFSRKRRHKNVIICLYDTSDDFKSGCDFMKKTADSSTHVHAQPISKITDFDFLSDRMEAEKLSANTMYVIYNGHSAYGHIHLLPYSEFATKLNILFEQTDNGFILLDTCYGGGFQPFIEKSRAEMKEGLHQSQKNEERKGSKDLAKTDSFVGDESSFKKVRVVSATSMGPNYTAKLRRVQYYGDEEEIECLPCMLATGTYVLDKSEGRFSKYLNLDPSKYRTYGDLRNIEENCTNGGASMGLFIFKGHDVNLNHYAGVKFEERNQLIRHKC